MGYLGLITTTTELSRCCFKHKRNGVNITLSNFLVTGRLVMWWQHTHLKPIPEAHETLEDWWFSHPMGAKHFAWQYVNVGYVLSLFTTVLILRKTQEALYIARRDTNRHLPKIQILFITKFSHSLFYFNQIPHRIFGLEFLAVYFSNCSETLNLLR